MSVRRINAIPPAGIPNHALPLYGLPVGDLSFSPTGLAIIRGGITLGNPAFIDKGRIFTVGKKAGFRFTVRNPLGNPEATITEFSINGDIQFFQAFNTSSNPVGITLADNEDFELCIFTSYGIDTLHEGFNYFSGEWVVGNTFAGATDGEVEEAIVNISYYVYVEKAFDNGKVPPFVSGKLSPNTYISEYEYQDNKEKNSDISLNPKD